MPDTAKPRARFRPAAPPLSKQAFAIGIKMHRDRLGLTQAQTAELCGVSPRVWWNWENASGEEAWAVTMEGVLARLAAAMPAR